jgi:hypothetical protein
VNGAPSRSKCSVSIAEGLLAGAHRLTCENQLSKHRYRRAQPTRQLLSWVSNPFDPGGSRTFEARHDGALCGGVSGLKTRKSEDGDFSKVTKGRQWRPFLGLHEVLTRTKDWLAGDAVLIAPVSGVDSLLTGNLTGKIGISALWETILEQKAAAPQRLVG